MLKRILSRLRSERGDTLVEVTFALGIMTTVLIGSTVIATKAFQLSATAKYRTQLVNAAVEQAEALRSYRDNTPTWAQFVSGINGVGAGCALPSDLGFNCFAMQVSGGLWSPTSNYSSVASSYTAGTIPHGTVVEIRNVGSGAASACAVKLEVHYGSPSILSVGALSYNEGEITVELVNQQFVGPVGDYAAKCQP